MKILIAVDGSRYSTKAVKHVIKHFNWFSGPPELHLLFNEIPQEYVTPPSNRNP